MASDGGEEGARRDEPTASTSTSTIRNEQELAPVSTDGLGPTVIDFMNKRNMLAEDGDEEEALAAWEDNFVRAADPDTLIGLIRAANLFGTGKLMDVITWRLIDLMKEKTDNEIRQVFHIKNDLNLEEEKLIHEFAQELDVDDI